MRPLHFLTTAYESIIISKEKILSLKTQNAPKEMDGYISILDGDVLYVSDCIIAECIFPLDF